MRFTDNRAGGTDSEKLLALRCGLSIFSVYSYSWLFFDPAFTLERDRGIKGLERLEDLMKFYAAIKAAPFSRAMPIAFTSTL